jgi:hypothetical protein
VQMLPYSLLSRPQDGQIAPRILALFMVFPFVR